MLILQVQSDRTIRSGALTLLADNSLLDTSLKNTSNDFDDIPIPEDITLPPKEDLQILLNRIEMQLPKDDHVKYDSRFVAGVTLYFPFKFSSVKI